MPLRKNSLSGNKSILGMEIQEITAAAALVAISIALQLVHVGIPFGYVWVDLVAIPWIIAFFLFGGRSSLVVSLVSMLLIIIFAPFGFIGGPVKWVATLPMWLLPWIWVRISGSKNVDFKKKGKLIAWIGLAVVIRSIIIIPFNYYIAFPLVGVAPLEAMALVPWWLLAGLNVVQGILEVMLAWLLVFRFRLDRFATW